MDIENFDSECDPVVLQQEINLLNEKLRISGRFGQELLNRLEIANQQVEAAQLELENVYSEVSDLQEEIWLHKTEKSNLEVRIATLNTEMKELRSENLNLISTKDELQQIIEIDESGSPGNGLQRSRTDSSNNINTTNHQTHVQLQLEVQLANLKKEMESLRQSNIILEDQVQELLIERMAVDRIQTTTTTTTTNSNTSSSKVYESDISSPPSLSESNLQGSSFVAVSDQVENNDDTSIDDSKNNSHSPLDLHHHHPEIKEDILALAEKKLLQEQLDHQQKLISQLQEEITTLRAQEVRAYMLKRQQSQAISNSFTSSAENLSPASKRGSLAGELSQLNNQANHKLMEDTTESTEDIIAANSTAMKKSIAAKVKVMFSLPSSLSSEWDGSSIPEKQEEVEDDDNNNSKNNRGYRGRSRDSSSNNIINVNNRSSSNVSSPIDITGIEKDKSHTPNISTVLSASDTNKTTAPLSLATRSSSVTEKSISVTPAPKSLFFRSLSSSSNISNDNTVGPPIPAAPTNTPTSTSSPSHANSLRMLNASSSSIIYLNKKKSENITMGSDLVEDKPDIILESNKKLSSPFFDFFLGSSNKTPPAIATTTSSVDFPKIPSVAITAADSVDDIEEENDTPPPPTASKIMPYKSILSGKNVLQTLSSKKVGFLEPNLPVNKQPVKSLLTTFSSDELFVDTVAPVSKCTSSSSSSSSLPTPSHSNSSISLVGRGVGEATATTGREDLPISPAPSINYLRSESSSKRLVDYQLHKPMKLAFDDMGEEEDVGVGVETAIPESGSSRENKLLSDHRVREATSDHIVNSSTSATSSTPSSNLVNREIFNNNQREKYRSGITSAHSIATANHNENSNISNAIINNFDYSKIPEDPIQLRLKYQALQNRCTALEQRLALARQCNGSCHSGGRITSSGTMPGSSVTYIYEREDKTPERTFACGLFF